MEIKMQRSRIIKFSVSEKEVQMFPFAANDAAGADFISNRGRTRRNLDRVAVQNLKPVR